MITPNEAAKLTGKSKSTILRAVRQGKVSGRKNDDGVWEIDPSDLSRRYKLTIVGSDALDAGHDTVRDAPRTVSNDAGDTPELSTENAVLQVQLDAVKQMADERAKTIEDLRHRLDKSEEKRDEAQTKLTALLTDQRPTAPEAPVGSAKAGDGRWLYLLILGAAAVLGALYGPELLIGLVQ